MTQSKQIKSLILQLLSDHKEHTTQEMNDLLVTNGILLDSKSTLLRNVLHNLKKEYQNLDNPRRGVYQLAEEDAHPKNKTSQLDVAVLEIQKAIQKYKAFHWYSCSDTELEEARTQVKTLLTLANTITKELT